MSSRCDHHDCSAHESPTTDETAQSDLRKYYAAFFWDQLRLNVYRAKPVFPSESLLNLSLVANISLILFLFLVSLEIDTGIIEGNARLRLPIALGGMVLPFGLGAALSVVSQIYRPVHQIDLFHALYWCFVFDHCFSCPVQIPHRVQTHRHHSRR